MKNGLFPWIETAIVVYCAVQSRDLVSAWTDAPFDRLGYVALAIWSLPWMMLGLAPRLRGRPVVSTTAVSAMGLVASFVGSLADLNFLKYWGLAVSLAAFMPWRWKNLPWLVTAVSWMPVLGYFAKDLGADKILVMRLAASGAGALWALMIGRSAIQTQAGAPCK